MTAATTPAHPTTLVDDLDARGLVHDATDLARLRAQLEGGRTAVYYGCDPTADSLHVGNLVGLVMLRRFQDAGHTAIALAGGATGMIGDPSGRSEERNLLDPDTLDHNVGRIAEQLGRIVDLDDDRRGVLVDNREWTEPLTLLGFLRDVGKHVTVNQMLGRESVRARLDSEHGISFTEFSYMLLQAHDYLWLHDHLGCTVQIGGSDQWGNIVAGVDLIRRLRRTSVHAISWPLLTAADGSKLGKTTGARTWLAADRTSPYQFWQHWMQVADDDVGSQLRTFSRRPLEELDAVVAEHRRSPERRVAQRLLADEMTSLVHGEQAARAAVEAADLLFRSDPTGASASALATLADEVPSSRVAAGELDDPLGVLVGAGLASSNGDARRGLSQGAFSANGRRLGADGALADVPLLHERYLLLRKGKKHHHLVEVFR